MTQDLTQPFQGKDQGGPAEHAFCPASPTQNGDGSTRPPLAPPAARSQRIDALCNQFETKLQAGEGPRIEDSLVQAEADVREDLLCELLAIEVWHRRAADQEPVLEDYLHRFPADAAAVRRGFVRGASPEARVKPVARAEVPPLLGDYEIIEELGRGGMGVVYKARHRRLKKLVALKVLRPDWAANRQALERFTREIEAAGRLHHANLVTATDAREDAGFCFLVMEYVEGRNLAALVRRYGRLPVADACEISRQVAVGLEHSHRQGLVHRDIQPSNVMLADDGTVKILDMGLARLQDSLSPREGLTSSGQLLGNPDYVSPEQACGEAQIDIRGDIYGLGCTLYYLLLGVPPFGSPDHASFAAKVAAHLHKPFPSISMLRGDVPQTLQGVLGRMVAKQRQERFADPAEVTAALTPFCAGADLSALLATEGRDLRTDDPTPRPVAPHAAAWPPQRLVRMAGAAALGTLLLVAALVAWGTWKTTSGQPAVRVEKAALFVRRHGDDLSIQKLLLEAGAGKSNPELEPLAADDDFKLQTEFNRPTHWYLVWIDTEGVAEVVAHSQQPERVAEYPAGNNLIGVNPQDRAGTHLLLLLASDRNPQAVQDQLRQRLHDVGAPPMVPYPQDVQVRGAGAVMSTTANLDPGYWEKIEQRLPEGVQWVDQLYLPTVK
jgi:tRNA A-37 threonylcarbamoyl transferase component Bud32